MHFQKKGQEVENEAENAKKFRKVANIVRNTITLDHFSSVQKDDWNEQLRAGVKMWVNKHTGEVATECPWQNVPQTPLQRMIRAKNQRRQSNASIPSIQPHEVGMGTGSLVYDGKEVEELFKILDDAKQRARKDSFEKIRFCVMFAFRFCVIPSFPSIVCCL